MPSYSHRIFTIVIAFFFAAQSGCASSQNQPVCAAPPLLGEGGTEICVLIQETGGATFSVRAPATAPLVVQEVVGEFTVDVVIGYAEDATGLAITMEGTVARTTTGNAKLSIIADAGWGAVFQNPGGTLDLVGFSTATSYTELGGAGWSAVGITPAQDVLYKPILRTVSASIQATPITPITFSEEMRPPQPLNADIIGVHMQTTFSINELNGITDVPAGVGFALPGSEPPKPDLGGAGSDGWPHFECYAIEEFAPESEVRRVKLRDQFGIEKTHIGRIKRLCTPVDKNGEGIPDPELHLVCYEILKGQYPQVPVETNNQFGRARMKVLQAQELCVPSTKKLLKEEKQEQYQYQEQSRE
jgi:hypothetical protein